MVEPPEPAELSEEDETAGSELDLDLSTVYVSFSAEINANTTESLISGVGVNQFTGAPRLEEKYLRELLDGVSANHTRMGSIMEERTDLDATQVQALFLEAQTKDAAYAVGVGIVHEIKPVEIPPGSPVISLVFQR